MSIKIFIDISVVIPSLCVQFLIFRELNKEGSSKIY